jgi:hypothetical protein
VEILNLNDHMYLLCSSLVLFSCQAVQNFEKGCFLPLHAEKLALWVLATDSKDSFFSEKQGYSVLA